MTSGSIDKRRKRQPHGAWRHVMGVRRGFFSVQRNPEAVVLFLRAAALQMTILAALRPLGSFESYKLIKKFSKEAQRTQLFAKGRYFRIVFHYLPRPRYANGTECCDRVNMDDDPKTTTNAAPHAKRDGVQRTSNALRGAWAHATPGSMRCIAPRPAAALLCSGERIAAVSTHQQRRTWATARPPIAC